MSASLRERLFGSLFGSVFVASVAVAPDMAPAQGSDYDCPPEIVVPCTEARDTRGEVVWSAVARSNPDGHVALIYYGDDPTDIERAIRVVQHFRDAGVSTGLVLADATVADGTGRYQIYVGGFQTTDPFASSDAVEIGNEINLARARVAEALAGSSSE